MKLSRFSDEQIIGTLREQEAGAATPTDILELRGGLGFLRNKRVFVIWRRIGTGFGLFTFGGDAAS